MVDHTCVFAFKVVAVQDEACEAARAARARWRRVTGCIGTQHHENVGHQG